MQNGPCTRKRDAITDTPQQHHINSEFQLSNLTADSTLGHTKPSRGLSEAETLADYGECPQ